MISTVLVEHPWVPITVLIAFAIAGPIAGMLLAGHPFIARWLLAVSVVAVLLLTLVPDGDPQPGVRCAVDLPYLSPTSVESLANVLLLAPTALLAGVLLRRPIAGAAGAVALSVAVETVQALVPAFGRACDTSDLITNALGALLGGALAFIALRLATRRRMRTWETPSEAHPLGPR